MPIDRNNNEEREARIERLLEEERQKAEALKRRSDKTRRQAKAGIRKSARPSARKKPG